MATISGNTEKEKDLELLWERPLQTYHAHFDCFSGAAGDMLLAACLDAAASSEQQQEQQHEANQEEQQPHLRLLKRITRCIEEGLPELKGEFTIQTKRVWRGGMASISALHVSVQSRYNHAPAPVPTNRNTNTSAEATNHQKKAMINTQEESHHHHHHQHDHGSEANQGHSHHHAHHHQHYSDPPHDLNSAEKQQHRESDIPDEGLSPAHSHGHQHAHNHNHNKNHGHSHGHTEQLLPDDSDNHNHIHTKNGGGPLRNLPEIRTMLEHSSEQYVPSWVRNMAIATFTKLADAEAKTHGANSIDTVFFHEVGAVDSIVDTIGTLLALYYLGVTTVSCSRIPVGEGTVWTAHGVLPVPAPATLRILQGMPLCQGPPGITGELVTPTGAALLATLTKQQQPEVGDGVGAGLKTTMIEGRPPSFTIRCIGIGAGTKDFHRHPNILRLWLGDTVVTK